MSQLPESDAFSVASQAPDTVEDLQPYDLSRTAQGLWCTDQPSIQPLPEAVALIRKPHGRHSPGRFAKQGMPYLRAATPLIVLALLAAVVFCIGTGPVHLLFQHKENLSMKLQAKCDGEGCACDCSWADEDSCSAQNTGRHCFDSCCGAATKKCSGRGGCACDCSWASEGACALDDGGCCWECCCGETNSDAPLIPQECLASNGDDDADDHETEEPSHSLEAATPATLFCFAVMRADGYERELVKQQHTVKTSVFLCDGHAIYSNQVIRIAPSLTTLSVNSSLKCDYGGQYNTALNTDIFMTVWTKVITDQLFSHYDWTVKVDPDAVFIPWRLRAVLADHREGPNGVYFVNCKYGLHGPIEVFSRRAVRALGAGMQRCAKHFYQKCQGPCPWGEDMYIDQCMSRVLDVHRVSNYKLLMEDHCDPPPGWRSCGDPTHVTFHPFKSWEMYEECLNNAERRCPEPTTTTTTLTSSTSTETVSTTSSTEEPTTSTTPTRRPTMSPTTVISTSSMPSTSRTMTATTTATSTTTTATATTTTTRKAVDCDLVHCEFQGISMTCKSLHRMEITRQFIGRESACALAYASILEICPHCAVCTLHEVGCGGSVVAADNTTSASEKASSGSDGEEGHEQQPFFRWPFSIGR